MGWFEKPDITANRAQDAHDAVNERARRARERSELEAMRAREEDARKADQAHQSVEGAAYRSSHQTRTPEPSYPVADGTPFELMAFYTTAVVASVGAAALALHGSRKSQ